jgi:Ethylbenzene dehydrogenase/Prokaryotic cytochrome b561
MRGRKTDYGTIILHWLLVGAFGVAFVSGMRIATEAPERTWINAFDAVLPQNVWVIHMQAAVVLVAVALTYAIYVVRSGLGRRIRLDKVRLRGLFGRGQARRGAANIVLYWVFFVAMLALMASGGLLYFGYFAGYDTAMVHWYATWAIVGFSGLHILSHFGIGGASQLLRIFRPTGLSAPPPELDAVELLTMLVEQQSARLQPELERPEKSLSEKRSSHAFEMRAQPTKLPKDTAPDRRRAVPNSVPRPAPATAARGPARLRPDFQRADKIPSAAFEAQLQPMQPPDTARDRRPAVRNSVPHYPAPATAARGPARLQPDFEPADKIPSAASEAQLQPMQPPEDTARDRRPAVRNSVPHPAPATPARSSVRPRPEFGRADRIPSHAFEAFEAFEAQVQSMRPPKDTAPDWRPAIRNSVAGPASGPSAKSRASKPRNPTFQSNPLVVAAAVAITGVSLIVASDRMAVDQLQIHRISSAEAPILDGDTSDRAWRGIQPFSVTTNQGGNFDGKGESKIDIRAVHDGTWAYFLFTWEDPTRSLKHLPLIKEIDGWHLLHDGYETGDEHDYNEDKFSVLFTTLDVTLAGDRTFHAGPHPIPDAPPTMTGRGLHYTPGENVYADVWLWKATNGGSTGWMDDTHFGPPLDPTPMQVSGNVPYKGGFAPDPGAANYSDNFVMSDDALGGNRTVAPRRLPKSLAATSAAMGEIDLDPNHGESDGARWFMTEAESIPYSLEQDARVPVGTVIPGVIIAGDFAGDRADVRCAARWASGHWALEVARRLDTHSQYDVPLQTGIFMRVAAFDHSQIRHTRHVRPIRLEVE